MEQTSLPTPQQLQEKINRNISDATQRYQAAITNPNALPTLQPVMHPADTFFAPPFTNPRLTTCLVCAAPFPSHAELCQHVEMSHPTIYTPQVQNPPTSNTSPFAAPRSVFPLNHLQPSLPITGPWTPMSSTAPTPITVPSSGKPVQLYRCNICDIGCDTMVILNSHLAGQKHRKKVELREAFLKAAVKLQEEGISEVNPRLWVCKLCTTGLESENAVLQHLEASKHKRLRQNRSTNEQAKRLRTSPVTALQAADDVASTPVSAALAVLKDDNAPLPPVSSLFTPPFPATSFPNSTGYTTRPMPPNRSVTGPPFAQSSQPGAPRAFISKNPRPPPTNTPNRQSGPSFSCSVCFVTCNSMDSLNAHLASGRHKRKQNLVESANNPVAVPPPASSQNIRCEVCGVIICGQPNFEAHLKGKPHAKKLRLLSQKTPSGATDSTGNASTSPLSTPPRNLQVNAVPQLSRPSPTPIQAPIPPIQPPPSTEMPASSSGDAAKSTETTPRIYS